MRFASSVRGRSVRFKRRGPARRDEHVGSECRKHRYYSWRMLSTGSNPAANVAGAVPKSMPTEQETTIATTTESAEMGIRYPVKKRTDNGNDSPKITPAEPPMREIRIASDKN